MFASPVIYFFCATVACSAVLVPIRFILRLVGVIDQPNARSSHTIPTVRGGGVGIVLVLLAGIIAAVWPDTATAVGIGAPLLCLACVSFWDDLRPLGVRVRLGVQVAASATAIGCLSYVLIRSASPGAVAMIIALVGVVGYTNAFNFMDGINGIAAVQGMIAGLGTALIAVAAGLPPKHSAVLFSLVVGGASAGFLPFNFPRATMFMGDVGSATLGFALAVIAAWVAFTTTASLILPLLCLHLNFIGDTVITMFRRWRRGEVVYQAHREHFYQRAVRSGRSHTQVTLIIAMLQVVIAVVSVAIVRHGVHRSGLIILVAFTAMVWVAFFAWCEHVFVVHEREKVSKRPVTSGTPTP